MILMSLIQAWSLSPDLNSIPAHANEHDLRSAEKRIGHRLPPSLRELYGITNGPYLLSGNLRIFPMHPAETGLGLISASEQLREWKWPIPEEVLVFADDGSEGLFGIWLPETRSEGLGHPIVEIGSVFEPECMAIAGTDLAPFLLGWTAYYSLLLEADHHVLDAIGVPPSLRDEELDDELFAQLRRWADPGLPDPYPDPYEKGHSAQQLTNLL